MGPLGAEEMGELATPHPGSWLAGVGIYLALLLIGYLLLRVILRRPTWLEAASLSFPLGLGLTMWILFLGSWMGFAFNPATLVVVLLGLSILLSFGAFLGEGQVARARSGLPNRADLFLLLFLLPATLLAAYLAVGRGHSTYDVTAGWAVKGYGIALAGDVAAGADWGLWGLAYPLNIHLTHAVFMLVGAEAIPLSKLLPPLFFLSTLLVVLDFWSREGVPFRMRGLGILFAATNPLIFLHSTMGFANLPFTCYLVGAVLWGIMGLGTRDRRASLLAGVLLGMASWTRAEGVGYALVVLGSVALGSWLETRELRWPELVIAALPVGVFAGAWMAFGWSSVGDSHLGVAMRGVVGPVADGDLNLAQLHLVITLFFERAILPENWGLFVPVVAGLGGVGLAGLALKRTAPRWGLLVPGVAVAAVPFALFYVRSFTRIADFRELLIRSFDRAFIPGFFMLLVLSISLFVEGWNGERVEPAPLSSTERRGGFQ